MFDQNILNKMDAIVALYDRKAAALLPILNMAQDIVGHVSPEVEAFASQYLNIPIVHVREVVSFYHLLRQEPAGKCHVQICVNTSCMLRGAGEIIDYMKQKLGVDMGATTVDGKITIEAVECLGACEYAPVAQVNKTYAGNLTSKKIDQIFAAGGTHVADWCAEFPQYSLKKGEFLLADFFREKDLSGLEAFEQAGGYRAARKMIGPVKPEDMIEPMKQSNLRGLGGAGFAVGMKWSLVPRDVNKPKYLVVNADEGEPGTFKDKYIMVRAPHQLLEGVMLAAYAHNIHKAYIYIRKEYELPYEKTQQAVDEAYAKGYLGKNIFGTGYDLDVVVHRGAGAYICGEESALLSSLEGNKGYPRLKPPFPAVVGLFGCPTLIHNVETLAYIPYIYDRGPEWFAALGSEKNGGMKLYCVSGHVNRPGVYELPMGTTVRELIYDYALGIPDGKHLKAVIPGGISAPILRADEIDVKMDFDSLRAAGTMMGSSGVMVLDETVDMVEALYHATRFFKHESCGQCSPCREGTGWLYKIINRVIHGEGRVKDLDNMLETAKFIAGNTICAFGDAAGMPVTSYINKFRPEFEAYINKAVVSSRS